MCVYNWNIKYRLSIISVQIYTLLLGHAQNEMLSLHWSGEPQLIAKSNKMAPEVHIDPIASDVSLSDYGNGIGSL